MKGMAHNGDQITQLSHLMSLYSVSFNFLFLNNKSNFKFGGVKCFLGRNRALQSDKGRGKLPILYLEIADVKQVDR